MEKMIKCPCCENTRSESDWYDISNDSFYICPQCKNTCTPDEILPQLNGEEQKTGEQVYAELDKRIAIDIMRWKPHYVDGSLRCFMTNNDKMLFYSESQHERDWQPSSNLMEAYQVIEHLRKEMVYLDVKCDSNGYWMELCTEGDHFEFKQRVAFAELPKYICEIALKTIYPSRIECENG